MQRGEHVGRGLIALGDRGRRIALDDGRVAEILGDQESGLEIGVVNGGRGEATRAQAVGDSNERPDISAR